MNTSKVLSLIGAAAIACIVTSAYADTISTASGNFGSDAEFDELLDGGLPDPVGGSVKNGDSMNTRTSSNGDRNNIIGLKFDLTGYDVSELMGVSLHLYNYRNNSSSRQVALYGVAQGTVSGTGAYTTETWSDTTATLFGDLPGLLASDDDPLTQSLNLASLTPLGVLAPIDSTSEGTVVTFDDAALTAFIQGYTTSHFVTLLLAAPADYTSSGQWRAASREAASLNNIAGAAGDFAPYLEFSVIPEPASLALLGLGSLALMLRRRN